MFGGSVLGLSSLRQREAKSNEPSEQSKQMQAYLAKYTRDKKTDSGKVKKKRKKAVVNQPGGIRIFEENNTGFRNSGSEEVVEDEEAPVVANPEEAERALRQVQEMQAGALTDSWAEVPTIVGDIPSVTRKAPPSSGLSDLSPPRRRRHDSPDASPPRKHRQSTSDASPPMQKHDNNDNISSPRKRRHDSPDTSPPRRQRHGSPDISPPGKHQLATADASPPRRRRHDSPDLSPVRKGRHDSPDLSPPRQHQRSVNGRDGKKPIADPDLNSKRRGRHDSPDISPSRQGASSQANPDAKRKGSTRDLSPPRKRRGVSIEPQTDSAGRPRFMADGGRAGKVTGQELQAEMQAKAAKEAADFAAMGVQMTGHGAQTVYRDKSGKRVTLEELKAQQAASKKPVAETPAWGGGMAQQRAAEQRRQDMQAEAAKPFARRREDVDALLKERERFGDPMAHLVKKRPAVEAHIVPAALQKKMKKAGFVIPQSIPAHSYLKRNLGPPGNRYNIRPGRHWDGVDRSTGFEKDMFAIINERKHRSQEAHMWSQGDM